MTRHHYTHLILNSPIARGREPLTSISLAISSAVLVLLFWAILPASYATNQSTDYTTFYEPVALNILSGEGLTVGKRLATRYPPGYPAILASQFALSDLLGVEYQFVSSFFLLLYHVLGCVLLYWLAKRFWPAPIALLPPLLWMSYPLALWYTKQPNSEGPFIILLFAAMISWIAALQQRHAPAYRYLIVGILIGCATLVRPIAIGLGAVMALCSLACSEARVSSRLRFASFIILGNLFVVMPWILYVHAQTDQWILVTSGGLLTISDGWTFGVRNQEWRQTIYISRPVLQLLTDLALLRPEIRSIGDFVSALVQLAPEHPVGMIRLVLLKAGRSWYGTDSLRLENLNLAIQSVYLIGLLSSLLYKPKNAIKKWKIFLPLASVVVCFWLMTILTLSIVRYMVPAIGLLFLLAPHGLMDPLPNALTFTHISDAS